MWEVMFAFCSVCLLVMYRCNIKLAVTNDIVMEVYHPRVFSPQEFEVVWKQNRAPT